MTTDHKWPRIRDLGSPIRHQIPFRTWLAETGATRPELPGEDDQDGYYQRDWEIWVSGGLNWWNWD